MHLNGDLLMIEIYKSLLLQILHIIVYIKILCLNMFMLLEIGIYAYS